MTVTTKAARRISAEGAVALVRSGDWLDYGAVLGSPDAFDTALAERVGELHDVKIRGCLSVRPRAVLAADPEREHFHFFNWHLSGWEGALKMEAASSSASSISAPIRRLPLRAGSALHSQFQSRAQCAPIVRTANGLW